MSNLCFPNCAEVEVIRLLSNRPEFVNAVAGWMRTTKIGIILCIMWTVISELPDIFKSFKTQCEHCQPSCTILIHQNFRGISALINVILCMLMLIVDVKFLQMVPNFYVYPWIGVNVLSALVGIGYWIKFDRKKKTLCQLIISSVLHMVIIYYILEFYAVAEYKVLIE